MCVRENVSPVFALAFFLTLPLPASLSHPLTVFQHIDCGEIEVIFRVCFYLFLTAHRLSLSLSLSQTFNFMSVSAVTAARLEWFPTCVWLLSSPRTRFSLSLSLTHLLRAVFQGIDCSEIECVFLPLFLTAHTRTLSLPVLHTLSIFYVSGHWMRRDSIYSLWVLSSFPRRTRARSLSLSNSPVLFCLSGHWLRRDWNDSLCVFPSVIRRARARCLSLSNSIAILCLPGHWLRRDWSGAYDHAC